MTGVLTVGAGATTVTEFETAVTLPAGPPAEEAASATPAVAGPCRTLDPSTAGARTGPAVTDPCRVLVPAAEGPRWTPAGALPFRWLAPDAEGAR